MAFDAAALSQALERPSVVVERTAWWERVLVAFGILRSTVTIKGRLLSHREWLPFEAGFQNIEDKPEKEVVALYEGLVSAMGFPRWRLRRMEGAVILALVTHFLACQYRSLGIAEMVISPTSTSSSLPEAVSPNGMHMEAAVEG